MSDQSVVSVLNHPEFSCTIPTVISPGPITLPLKEILLNASATRLVENTLYKLNLPALPFGQMLNRIHFFLCLGILLVAGLGCRGFNNLTPPMQPRDGNGMYRFEMAWETKESGVIHEMVQPRLLINNESHPMSRTAMTTNRWETLVSIPKEETFVNYRYVVNYAKKGGKLQPSLNSIASKPYELQIIETNRVPIRTYK